MSEEKDKEQDQKTEEPTQQRLDKAFERGQVAFSKEVMHWLILGSIALTLIVIAPYSANLFLGYFSSYITRAGEFNLGNPSDSQLLLTQTLFDTLKVYIPTTGFFIVCAIAGGLLQTRFAIQKTALMPKGERISPWAGAKRIFSKRNLVEFIKGICKLGVVSIALYFFFKSRLAHLDDWLVLNIGDFFSIVTGLILKSVVIVLCILTLISVLDYLYQRYELMKSLRMTKEEVKKEFKESEGDPHIKQKIKQLGQQRIRKNISNSVANATAVITNPTHYAVAIHYDHETMPAPIVVAKGTDYLALKIREIAEKNKVPIFENPPLARALYKSVEVDQQVPAEHYRAIAEIIRLVLKLKKRPFN